MLQVWRRACQKECHDRLRGNLPCTPEEVVLYLRQEISALLEIAVATEVTKRVEMRNVSAFETFFPPIGLFPCAISPLVNAALDLMTMSTTHQHPG